MGDEVAPRRDWIEQNVDFNANDNFLSLKEKGIPEEQTQDEEQLD